MRKLVLDTNVLVSSLIQKSYPYLIINEVIYEKKAILCLSDELESEYQDVLSRGKFSKYKDFISSSEILMSMIKESAVKFYPKITYQTLKDKDDNMLLELAFESKAEFLITGNTKDFTIKNFKKTKIVTSAEYWEKYR